MNTHRDRLSLAHLAALGLSEVVFGPDGDFEGAPDFTGPVSVLGHDAYYHVLRVAGTLVYTLTWQGLDFVPTTDACFLDLRVPSVLLRVAGLCGFACGAQPGQPAWVGEVVEERSEDEDEHAPPVYTWALFVEQTRVAIPPVNGRVFEPTGITSAAEFLAALFVHLAPRLVARARRSP